jgi:hypothetical protein
MNRLAKFTALFALVLVLLPLFEAEAAWGNLRQQRLEIGRALIEVQSSNLPTILPYYADDIEYHDPIVDIYGKADMTDFLFQLFGSSPDLVTTIEDETLVGGVYSATWTMTGQFAGVPYTSKGISIIKFRGWTTSVYYQRDYYSENDIMINIPGLDQAAIGFRTYYRCAVDPTFDCPLDASEFDIPEFKPDEVMNADKFWGWFGYLYRLRQARLEIGRALVEINASDWVSLLPYYTDDYEYHDPIVDIYGMETLVPFFGQLFASSPDLITTVDEETLINGVYTATWTMTGMFDGVPYSAKGMSILKFRGWSRQIYYSRDYYTEGDIMANIPGLDEAVAGFRVYYRCAVDPTFDCPLDEPEAKSSDLQPAVTFSLGQNYPNPFNPTTKISFVVPDGGSNVSLRIYDLNGRLVRTLVNGYESSGTHTVSWFGKDDQGQPVSSGTYFYQLLAPDFSMKKKMVLLK